MAKIVPDRHWRRPSTEQSSESLTRVQNIIGDFDTEHTMKYYDYWSQHYESDLEVLDYKVPDYMAESMFNFISEAQWNDPNFVILDVGAGTGQMAIALNKLDFKGRIDAVDGNSKMLGKAAEKGLYKNHTQHILLEDKPMPLPADYYDGIVCCCAMVPALIQPECLPDLIRVVKPGGLVYFTTRATDGNQSFRKRVDFQMEKMADAGVLQVKSEIIVPQYSWPVNEGDDDKHCISAVAICVQKLKSF